MRSLTRQPVAADDVDALRVQLLFDFFQLIGSWQSSHHYSQLRLPLDTHTPMFSCYRFFCSLR